MIDHVHRLIRLLSGDVRFTVVNPPGMAETEYLRSIDRSGYRRLMEKNPSLAVRRKGSLYRKSSPGEITGSIAERKNRIRRMSILAAAGITLVLGITLAAAGAGIFWLLIPLGAGIFLVPPAELLLHRYTHRVAIYYRLEGESGLFHNELYDRVRKLIQSDNAWLLSGATPAQEKPVYSESPRRHEVWFTRELPSYIYSSLEIPGIQTGEKSLHFFPDFLFHEEEMLHATPSYPDIFVRYREVLFHETEYWPADSSVAGYRWLYQRKDGGPDRRYKNNREISVMVYGEVRVAVDGRVLFVLLASDAGRARGLASFLGGAAGGYREELFEKRETGRKAGKKKEDGDGRNAGSCGGEPGEKRNGPAAVNDPLARARALLGIPEHSGIDEIKAAYRRLVKIHHPDMVAQTGREDVHEAVERMKEINAAYRVLVDSLRE